VKTDLAPELQSRLETTFEHISGDPGVTNELLDDAARVLLDWAQDEVSRLVVQTAGQTDTEAEATLAPKLKLLRQHLRRTAHLCAANAEPAESLRQMLSSPEYPAEEKPEYPAEEKPASPAEVPLPAATLPPATNPVEPSPPSCSLCKIGATLSSGFQRLFSKKSPPKGEKS